jgi:protein-S-isoprenylcysteine O-methyltransferase Ste14
MTVIARARVKTIGMAFLLGGAMFVCAGTLRWVGGWIYVAVLAASTMLPLYGPFRFDEGLLEERMTRKPDAKSWDRLFVTLVGVLSVALLTVSGLDRRWMWTPPMPRWTMWAAAASVVIATTGLTWSMWTNRFFSTVIRIQRDRGHQVITAGPYRVVRHPGYAAWTAQSAALPFLLGSRWALVPAGLLVVMFVGRTVLEDRVLKAELDGYREYAARVRSRLVPGIW